MRETSLPRYDELYVVSDLHMGGRPGFQVLRHGPRLGRFIRKLAGERPGERLGLVLNGDVIDSLSEDIQGYVAMEEAESMMDRIYRDGTFEPVWDALRMFIRCPGRSLVIVLGNHDIELALPLVQSSIRKEIAGDDDAARGRITFATQGAGYACRVGGARVLCTHGNEVDGWNLVDYERLRGLAIWQTGGMPFDPSEWVPNAGTRLVKDVMNDIKRKYAWIDLLKPENKAAVGVLLVLDPGQLAKIRNSLPVLWDRVRGELAMRGILSADGSRVNDPGRAEDIALRHVLGRQLLEAVQRDSGSDLTDADALLLKVERSLTGPARRPPERAPQGTLGWGQLLWDRLRGIDKAEALRRALQDWLAEDRSWDIAHPDATCRSLVERIGPSVDFVITGHTHLERALSMDGGAGRFYYNCGTWIRLLQLTGPVLGDAHGFGEVYRVLVKGSMEAIDQAEIPGEGGRMEPLVVDRTSAVQISSGPNGVVGRLYHVLETGPESVELDLVRDSEFWRKWA